MSGMTLEIREEDSGAIFQVGGRLMYENDSHLFHQKLAEELQRGKHWIVLDLSRVIGMSSTGLGILISAYRTVREQGASVKLADLSEKVRAVLQITRLNGVFEVFNTVEEALQAAKTKK